MDITCQDSLGNRVTRLYQWDVNQKLWFGGIDKNPLPIFQFSNSLCDDTISVTPELDQLYQRYMIVQVPNKLLEEADPIFVYIYVEYENDEKITIGSIYIPVQSRVRPRAIE